MLIPRFIICIDGLTGLPARAPKHRRMRGGGDGSGGVTGGGSQLDCVPRTFRRNENKESYEEAAPCQ